MKSLKQKAKAPQAGKRRPKAPVYVNEFALKLSFIQASGGVYFAIPKKIIPLAVERNRLKRYAREEWRKAPFAKKGLFVCLFAKGKIRKFRRKEFNLAYQKALSKALAKRG